MRRILPLLVFYGSFLSLPSAQQKGTLLFTYFYIAFSVAVCVLMVALRFFNRNVGLRKSELTYISMAILLVSVNYIVGYINEIDVFVWQARAIHVPMVIVYTLMLCYSELTPKDVLKSLLALGVIEMLLIFWVFITKGGQLTVRMTDLDGILVYSGSLVIAAFISMSFFKSTKKPLYLFLYFGMLVAAVMTGSRGLIVGIAVSFFVLSLKRMQIVAILVGIAGIYFMLTNGYLERFNIQDRDNFITVLAKYEEIQALLKFFLSNPLLGVGFGYQYQISLAGTYYTYSHNAIMFYLGYGGIIGVIFYFFPIVQFSRYYAKGWVLLLALVLFYSSSTVYTNVKHSLVMAGLVYIAARYQTRKKFQNVGSVRNDRHRINRVDQLQGSISNRNARS